MVSLLPAGWQGRPQDSRPPNQQPLDEWSPERNSNSPHPPPYNMTTSQTTSTVTPPPTPHYSHLPLGPSLTPTVASNVQSPSFVRENAAINYMQQILVSGRYSDFLDRLKSVDIQSISDRCCQESKDFNNRQQLALQADIPLITAYHKEIRDLELNIMAHEAQQISAISLPAGYQDEATAYTLKKSILPMMKVRAELLSQDYRLRLELLHIEQEIVKFMPSVMQCQVRINHDLRHGITEDQAVNDASYHAVQGLLPWNEKKTHMLTELRRCREARAGLEGRLTEAKGSL